MKKNEKLTPIRSFTLPNDVYAWLKDKADKDNRSVSNYLTTLIKTRMGK